jgi:hypothetical protein
MTARFASTINKYTHGTEFVVSAMSGGNLSTSGNIYIYVCAVNRAGRTFLSDGININYTNNQKIRITLNSTILDYANGEDIYKIIIAGNTTDDKTLASQLAVYEVKEANQTTIKTLPVNIDLTRDEHIKIASSVASNSNLPTGTDEINGMIRAILDEGLIYKLDAFAISGVYPATTGFWVVQESYGFYPNITDIQAINGANRALNQVLNPLLAPPKEDNTDSIPIRYWFVNGDTDDGGSALPVGTYLNLKLTVNGINGDSLGSFNTLFSGLIKTTLKGYYDPVTRTLDTSPSDSNILQIWTDTASSLQLKDELPRGQYAVYDIVFSFNPDQLQNRILEGDSIGLDIFNQGLFGTPSKLYFLTGSLVYNNGDLLRIFPAQVGIIRGSGSATIGNDSQGWDTPLLGENSYPLGLVADTVDQLAMISGTRGGDIRIIQDYADRDFSEVVRAFISTEAGISNASDVSNIITLNNNDRLQVTVYYPFNGTTNKGTIRNNYPDVIANSSIGEASVNKLTIYVVKDGTIYELTDYANVLIDDSQTITISDLTGYATIGSVPINADNYYCLWDFPTAPVASQIVGGGNLTSGNYSVYVAYSYPSPNTKIVSINHSSSYFPLISYPSVTCINESTLSFAELLNSLQYWRYPVADNAELRGLEISEIVPYHARAVNNLIYIYDPFSTDIDDDDIYIKPDNGVGRFIKQGGIVPTHTGEVTGDTSLILDKTAITNKTTVTAVLGDYVLISDTSDSGNLKKVTVDDFLTGGGVGDMQKSVYDVNNNGIVDNSTQLDGQNASYYLDRTNHTNTQLASTISDFDTAVDARLTGLLLDTNNLSDLDDISIARSNLGLGVLATQDAEFIDDQVAGLLVAGSNITLTYNDVSNSLTIDSTITSNYTVTNYVLSSFCQTTNNTPKALTIDGLSISSSNQIQINDNQLIDFDGIISAFDSNSKAKSWRCYGTLHRAMGANTTVIKSTNINVLTEETGTENYTIAFNADTTNGALTQLFTGANGVTINVKSIFTININATTGNTIGGQIISPDFLDGDKGDITVTSSGSVWTIDNDVVSYSKIQNVSNTDRLLGRVSSGSGDIEEIIFTDFAQGLLDDIDASTARATLEFDEAVDDRVANLLVAGNDINLNYNDGANTLIIEVVKNYDILSTNTTLNNTHYTVEVNTALVIITLPTAVGISAKEYTIINSSNGNITINTTSAQTIGNIIGSPTSIILRKGEVLSVISNNSNWRII